MDCHILSNDQSIELAVLGFTKLKGKTYYKISVHGSLTAAQNSCQHNDIIAENKRKVFILNPIHKS